MLLLRAGAGGCVVSLHLVIEDNAEDPQVPELTVCPTCEGEGIVPAPDDVSEFWFPCPACRCSSCGERTNMPPICADCNEGQWDG